MGPPDTDLTSLVRRPLLLPDDVRQLARDEQLVVVSGAKPLNTKKLRFDQKEVLARKLRRARSKPVALSARHAPSRNAEHTPL